VKASRWLAACMTAASLAGAPVWAQHVTAAAGRQAAVATLGAALDAAWQRAVAARESEGQRRRAEADRAVAGGLWAAPPSLQLSHRDDRLQHSAGSRETEIGVAVPLWLPGQRAARSGAAEVLAAQAAAAEQVARLHLAGELREAAWLVAALRAEAVGADGQVQALQQLADDVDRRVQAGDLARADALAARAEQLAAVAQQADVRQRLMAARSHWALLTGMAEVPELSALAVGEEPPGDVARHPELQLARLSTELARKRVALMQLSRREAPELSLGLRHDVPGRGEASKGSVVVGLRLPLGTPERNRPLEVAALTERDLAQTQEQRLQERLDSQTAAARESRASAVTQLEAESARARLLRERAALIDKSFRAGETPLPDLLRALAAAAQADSAVARQTAALGLAHARLQQTLGLLP